MEHTDDTRLGDQMSTARAVALVDDAGFHGHIVASTYTAHDETRPGRVAGHIGVLRIVEGAVIGPESFYENVEAVKKGLESELRVARRYREQARLLDPLDRLEAELEAYLTEQITVPNLITAQGTAYYMRRASAIAGAPAQVACMKLGTGNTAPSQTGAGAALVTYKAATDVAIDATWPQASLSTNTTQIQWQTTFLPGIGTDAALAEVVVVNDLADATSVAANTYSRALLSPTQPKNAADTLIIVWNHQGLSS